MASTQEIANWIKDNFNPQETLTIERVTERGLRARGLDEFEAPVEAEDKADKVLALLHKMRSEDLPFEFSSLDSRRLIGKRRVLVDDSEETKKARDRVVLVDQMVAAVYQCGDKAFEKICAGLMRLSGAKEAVAICSRDEGGIDVYGRLPLRLSDPNIRSGLLRTTILEKHLLFLGQCKCQNSSVGPSDIDAFHGASESCLRKYEGNDRPPSNRVPETYYRRQETCIRVFFTTSDYSDKAKSKADSLDITCVDGKQIAEFLVYHRIGLVETRMGVHETNWGHLQNWAEASSQPQA